MAWLGAVAPKYTTLTCTCASVHGFAQAWARASPLQATAASAKTAPATTGLVTECSSLFVVISTLGSTGGPTAQPDVFVRRDETRSRRPLCEGFVTVL